MELRSQVARPLPDRALRERALEDFANDFRDAHAGGGGAFLEP